LAWIAIQYDENTSTTLSYRFYEILRDMETPFQGVCAYGPRSTALTFGEQTERVSAGLASGEFFPLLGGRPHLGRLFGPEEDRTKGAHPVAVLEYGFWRDRFGSDPQAVGRQILLAGTSFTIIGVAEEGFSGPARDNVPDLWVPMTAACRTNRADGGAAIRVVHPAFGARRATKADPMTAPRYEKQA
jgi:hypothetical protein